MIRCTIRGSNNEPLSGCFAVLSTDNGPAVIGAFDGTRYEFETTVTGGADFTVSHQDYQDYHSRVLLDPDLPEVHMEAANTALEVVGDGFRRNNQVWLMKGSTELEAAARINQGQDLRAVFQQRKEAGANTIRVITGMWDDLGYSPTAPNHADVVRRTFDLAADVGFQCVIGVILNGTKQHMADRNRQVDFFNSEVDLYRPYPFVIPCLGNEINHSDYQDIDPLRFTKPAGVISSRGSYTTDHYPDAPLWDVHLYGARREPPPPGAKPFNNLNPYEYHPHWPLPCPHIAVESAEPHKYGFNPVYARQMGKCASVGAGGFFHVYENYPGYPSWGLWPPHVEACARAFYEVLK